MQMRITNGKKLSAALLSLILALGSPALAMAESAGSAGAPDATQRITASARRGSGRVRRPTTCPNECPNECPNAGQGNGRGRT